MINNFSLRGDYLKIAVQGEAADVEVIRELLSPWNASFTSLDEAEVVVVYKEKPLETKKTNAIPWDSADFMKWAKNMKLRVVRKPGEPEVPMNYRDRLGQKKLKLRHGLFILRRIVSESLWQICGFLMLVLCSFRRGPHYVLMQSVS